MNISGATSCFPNGSQGNLHMYGDHHHVAEDVVSSSVEASSGAGSDTHSTSLLYSLSILKDKLYQVQSLVGIFISPPDQIQPESTSIAIANMGTLIQEIIVTASSMMFTCQQMALCATSANNTIDELHQQQQAKQPGSGGILSQVQSSSGNNMRDVHSREGGGLKGHVSAAFYSSHQQPLDWYGDHHYDNSTNNNQSIANINSNNNEVQLGIKELGRGGQVNEGSSSQGLNSITYKNCDIIELNAADLLAKYTHYCQVCGKGFKRDANLRMHMRAHGDEYKSSAALSNPMKSSSGDKDLLMKFPRKYSCPQEGCRWNKRHAKFQPLKSMICVKNHYKRSHCPKMYVCKRCNQKQFSVLSDLRTHEKHCGDLKWQCSCGTTFSRKDKLMGHVALFVGHSPAINSLMKLGKVDQQAGQMQLDGK